MLLSTAFNAHYFSIQFNHYLLVFFFAQQWWHFQAYENIQDMHYDTYNENVCSVERVMNKKVKRRMKWIELQRCSNKRLLDVDVKFKTNVGTRLKHFWSTGCTFFFRLGYDRCASRQHATSKWLNRQLYTDDFWVCFQMHELYHGSTLCRLTSSSYFLVDWRNFMKRTKFKTNYFVKSTTKIYHKRIRLNWIDCLVFFCFVTPRK